MIITRWQAPLVPDKEQINMMFRAEGFDPCEEVVKANEEIPDHRHPFDEVRMVAEGELHLNIAGNRLLLRAGDKITIPSNTTHSFKVTTETPCLCICAVKIY